MHQSKTCLRRYTRQNFNNYILCIQHQRNKCIASKDVPDDDAEKITIVSISQRLSSSIKPQHIEICKWIHTSDISNYLDLFVRQLNMILYTPQ